MMIVTIFPLHEVVTTWSPSGHQVVTKWSVDSGCYKLSENNGLHGLNACYKGEKVRCHACAHTHENTCKSIAVEQYSAEAESAINP